MKRSELVVGQSYVERRRSELEEPRMLVVADLGEWYASWAGYHDVHEVTLSDCSVALLPKSLRRTSTYPRGRNVLVFRLDHRCNPAWREHRYSVEARAESGVWRSEVIALSQIAAPWTETTWEDWKTARERRQRAIAEATQRRLRNKELGEAICAALQKLGVTAYVFGMQHSSIGLSLDDAAAMLRALQANGVVTLDNYKTQEG